MSDVLRCDGPDCEHFGEFPFLGWWRLENASTVVVTGEMDRLDFCSWECLGAFVFDKAGDVAALTERIGRLDAER